MEYPAAMERFDEMVVDLQVAEVEAAQVEAAEA